MPLVPKTADLALSVEVGIAKLPTIRSHSRRWRRGSRSRGPFDIPPCQFGVHADAAKVSFLVGHQAGRVVSVATIAGPATRSEANAVTDRPRRASADATRSRCCGIQLHGFQAMTSRINDCTAISRPSDARHALARAAEINLPRQWVGPQRHPGAREHDPGTLHDIATIGDSQGCLGILLDQDDR